MLTNDKRLVFEPWRCQFRLLYITKSSGIFRLQKSHHILPRTHAQSTPAFEGSLAAIRVCRQGSTEVFQTTNVAARETLLMRASQLSSTVVNSVSNMQTAIPSRTVSCGCARPFARKRGHVGTSAAPKAQKRRALVARVPPVQVF